MPPAESLDLGSIDIQPLSPAQRLALTREIIRRARSERDKAVGIAIGRAFLWALRQVRRVSALRQASRSLVRKRRERIAAAQLHALSEQELADMGVNRGDIENCVRYCARRPR